MALKRVLIPLLDKLPYVRSLRKLLTAYEETTAYPPGHYYSPVPDVKELSGKSWQATSLPPSVEWSAADQLALFRSFTKLYPDFPFRNSRKAKEYAFEVPDSFFTIADTFHTWTILQTLRPRNIIEVGSGYSTVFLLDYFSLHQPSGKLWTIDPDPSRLNSLKYVFSNGLEVLAEEVQNIDLSVYKNLKANDVLFIDSSHISKAGSDLNYILFNVLPYLEKGVYIHVHDCYFPLEYTKDLIIEHKYAWNEAYLWKAFLMNNKEFTIWYFPDFIWSEHHEEYKKALPEIAHDRPCGLWIRKN